ncbi:MAG: hypothetical protein ACJ72M_10140 [Propionibacteriaceae bacterium]
MGDAGPASGVGRTQLADMVATITRVLSNSIIDLAARRYKETRDHLGEDD